MIGVSYSGSSFQSSSCACMRCNVENHPRYSTPVPSPAGIKSPRVGMKTPWGRVPEQAAWQTFEAEAMPHADRLFRLAMWLERDRTEAEDLVQETLIQALQSFHRYKPGTNCRAWLT